MASSSIRGQNFVCRCAACARKLRGKAATSPQPSVPSPQSSEQGFTLVEMIMVIVITGIIGGMIAMFIRAPVQGYVDSARRAEMTDIADTALRRISRDLRLALPNSVRVTPSGANFYLEFIPTTGGGRYRSGAPGNDLKFNDATDASFEVLGPGGVAATASDFLVIYNLGISSGACASPGADAYEGCNRRAITSSVGNTIAFTNTALPFPFESPGNRFHVVTKPVTYVCAPLPGGGGMLTRYWGYNYSVIQPTAIATLEAVNAGAQLATHVGLAVGAGGCSFTYNPNVVAQRTGVVTMQLTITENSESATLYNATHVSNEP